MAKKWSIKEDCIVCKYCVEKEYRILNEQDVNELMGRLSSEGFTDRSKNAVLKRVRLYQDLYLMGQSPYAGQQVLDVAEVYNRQSQEIRLAIKREIEKNYEPSGIVVETIEEVRALQALSQCPSDLISYLHKIDFNQTLPMVLQKYLDLKGLKNRQVYRKIGMKADTFSSILRGKYKIVKKENILKLCVGLRLAINEAEELMASAGYIFSNAIVLDVVIKACLYYRIYNPVKVNIELDENGEPELFVNLPIEE